MHSLARVLGSQGWYDVAEMHQRTLEGYEEVLEAEHLGTLERYVRLEEIHVKGCADFPRTPRFPLPWIQYQLFHQLVMFLGEIFWAHFPRGNYMGYRFSIK